MAYKQPKNTPMHNDGASEPITAAILALGAKNKSAQQKRQEQQMAKIAKDVETENLKG